MLLESIRDFYSNRWSLTKIWEENTLGTRDEYSPNKIVILLCFALLVGGEGSILT